MRRSLRVEVGVELERPERRPADEALPVEQHVRRARNDDVAAQERRDLHPVGVDLGRERLADRVDRHRPSAALVVREGERRRRRPRAWSSNGTPVLGELRAERVLVLRPARRDDYGVRAERGQRARRVPRPAADARRAARDDVTREMPDHGERRHGSQA